MSNAGYGDCGLVEQTTEPRLDELVNVHFKGVFFLTQSLLPLIADGGRIVNLSSDLTRVSAPGWAAALGRVGLYKPLFDCGSNADRV